MSKEYHCIALRIGFSEETITKASGFLQASGMIGPMSFDEIKKKFVDVEPVLISEELFEDQSILMCTAYMAAVLTKESE